MLGDSRSGKSDKGPEPVSVIRDPATGLRMFVDGSGKVVDSEHASGSGSRKFLAGNALPSTTVHSRDGFVVGRDGRGADCDRLMREASVESSRSPTGDAYRGQRRDRWLAVLFLAAFAGSIGASMLIGAHRRPR